MAKGQLTIFMIIGLFAIAVALLVFTMMKSSGDELPDTIDQVEQIKDVDAVWAFTDECVEKVSKDALFFYGLVGGEVDYFYDFFEYDKKYRIPYYFMQPVSYAPDVEDVENKILKKYIDLNLKRCTKAYQNVKGLTVQEGEVRSTVDIGPEAVTFTVIYPLTVKKGQQSAYKEKFTWATKSRIEWMIGAAYSITQMAEQDPGVVYWDYMTDLTRNGFNITAHAERDSTILYRMVDPYSLVHKEPYILQWAVQVKAE